MKRLIVGVSGASAAIYAIRLLEVLKETNDEPVETHLVISSAARKIILMETDFTVEEVEAMANYAYDIDDIGAAIASGSFKTDGMVIIPCSMKSLSAIANSYSANLLLRAADVTLKERRRLVVVVRETPLHRGHLQLMLRVTDMGAIIFPPLPAFYHRPQTIEDIVDHTVGRVLDLFGIDHALFERWGGSTGLTTGGQVASSRPDYKP